MDFTKQEKAVLFILASSFSIFLLLVLLRIDFQASQSEQNISSVSDELVVQVQGAVRNPGVYRVAQGTRLYELVDIAGGATGEAELQDLNLAAPLYDGQRIVIPSAEEKQEVFFSNLSSFLPQNEVLPSSGSDSLININTATEEQLESLPGIGEVLAGRIIQHRREKGTFSSPEDLLDVHGIGSKRLEEIREKITF